MEKHKLEDHSAAGLGIKLDPISKITNSKKKNSQQSGLANIGPEFNPKYCKKERKKESKRHLHLFMFCTFIFIGIGFNLVSYSSA
jgi:hypothetical protein